MERILLNPDSPVVHQTLRTIALREKTGASVVALYRRGKLIANPPPTTTLLPNDILVVLGTRRERAAARALIS
jgi:TrkA domain protein